MVNNPFREALLEKREFVFTLELVPGRGSKGKTQEDVLMLAEKAAKGKLIQALSITDNAGGHPALFPNTLGREICRLGLNPIIHFTCKDKNRNQIESILYALDRIEIQNLGVVSTKRLPGEEMNVPRPSFSKEWRCLPLRSLKRRYLPNISNCIKN
ncbi:MAG: methylenetetrahydrofolate reductase [Deltaproteobacteria bacterium]|nr:methylenetetrahydrofolate reductase [Deltaproteobacteria bacterium]